MSSKDNNKIVVSSVRVTKEQDEQIKKICANANIKPAAFLTACVEMGIRLGQEYIEIK